MSLTRREFFLAAAGLMLVACGKEVGGGLPAASSSPSAGAGAGAAKTASNLVAVGNGLDIISWNPYAQSSGVNYDIWEHIFETLVKYDWNNRAFVGDLATSWEVQPDNLTWVFHLRKGVHFHDGSPFTADDVVYSFNRIRTDKHSLQAPNLKQVDTMRAADPNTFVLKTKIPYAPLLGVLGERMILSKTVADKLGGAMDQHPTGTGPYRFVSWTRGQQFVVTRNDNWWGGRPAIAEGAFKPIPDAQARLTALQTGALQVMTNLPPQDMNLVSQTKGLHVLTARSSQPMFIGLQPHKPPLSSKQVRQAMNYAVDVDQIVKFVLQGRAYTLGQPLGPQYPSWIPNYQGYGYDPEKAKSLLKQAGYASGFDIVLTCTNGRYTSDKEIAQAIAGQLGKVGIRCTVDTPELGVFETRWAKGAYPMFMIGRGDIFDPDDYLTQYFQTGNTPRIGYSNPQVDALFKQEQATFDPPKRGPILQEICKLIMDDAPIIPLFNYQDLYGVASDLQWQPRPDEMVDIWMMKMAGA